MIRKSDLKIKNKKNIFLIVSYVLLVAIDTNENA